MKLDKLSKYRREALSQYQKGDLAAANRACARALKLAPRDFESLKLKSLLLRHASDNVTAIKVSMRAVNQTRDPVEQAALFHGIANSETELGNWEGAVLAYKRAIELDWSMASVYSLAILLSQTGNPGEAAVLFETVIKPIPS
jgi:tetratricopeptide (TPR) repeat protein